ncbi:MAG: hypothetical protein ACLP7Q_01740, partial [Isosphaeraceae bacterium]
FQTVLDGAVHEQEDFVGHPHWYPGTQESKVSHQEVQRARYFTEILIAIRVAGFPSGDVRLRSRHQEKPEWPPFTIARPTVFVVRPNMIQGGSRCEYAIRR